MDVEQFKDDLRHGRITPEFAAGLLEAKARELRECRRTLADAQRRIDELEKQQGAGPQPFAVV